MLLWWFLSHHYPIISSMFPILLVKHHHFKIPFPREKKLGVFPKMAIRLGGSLHRPMAQWPDSANTVASPAAVLQLRGITPCCQRHPLGPPHGCETKKRGRWWDHDRVLPCVTKTCVPNIQGDLTWFKRLSLYNPPLYGQIMGYKWSVHLKWVKIGYIQLPYDPSLCM